MAKQDFCCVGDYQIIIPYRDFEKMVQSANKIEHIEKMYATMEQRYTAMQELYREALQKIAEINRLL